MNASFMNITLDNIMQINYMSLWSLAIFDSNLNTELGFISSRIRQNLSDSKWFTSFKDIASCHSNIMTITRNIVIRHTLTCSMSSFELTATREPNALTFFFHHTFYLLNHPVVKLQVIKPYIRTIGMWFYESPEDGGEIVCFQDLVVKCWNRIIYHY